MKKLIAAMITLTMLLLALCAYAGGETVSLTFESKTYDIVFENAEVVDGALNVTASGFGSSIPIRDGEFLIPFWVYAVAGGETYSSTSVSCGSGTYTFCVDCDFIPEEIYIYEYDDEEHAVLLWQNDGEADAMQDTSDVPAPAFCDEWQLVSIVFFPLESNTGIFSIDGTLDLNEGSPYRSNLTLNADGTMASAIDVYDLLETVEQIPFSAPDLRLSDYTEWSYDGVLLTLSPGGVILEVAYDETIPELRLTYGGTFEIESELNMGSSDLGITMVLVPPEAPETT